MSAKPFAGHMTCLSLLSLTLIGCFHPPYNNFQKAPVNLKPVAAGVGVGAIAGTAVGNTILGAAIGGFTGTIIATYKTKKESIIKELQQQDIEFIQYGETMTLVVPVDHYFIFNTPNLNDICYPGLNNIIKLLQFYPKSIIYVAAFTDNVGSQYHKRMLSQAQAETMLTFLWANNIQAQKLKAEGYSDKHSIADNHLIHGSALNRRIEIQWFNAPAQPLPLSGGMK